MWNKIVRWWYFKVNNPIIRQGEHGGFKWCFRRYTLDVSTASGNFSARFTAAEHPYAYLISGNNDENIEGFCQMLYSLGMLLTTDQGLVNGVRRELNKYAKRIEKGAEVKDDDAEEKVAIEEEKSVHEYIEKPAKERRKEDRKTNRKFKKTAKKLKDEEKSGKEG